MSLSNLLFSGIELVTSWSLPYRRRLKMLCSIITCRKNYIKKYTYSDGIYYLVHIASLTQYTNTPLASPSLQQAIFDFSNLRNKRNKRCWTFLLSYIFRTIFLYGSQSFFWRFSFTKRVATSWTYSYSLGGKVRCSHGLRNLCVKQLIE
jgi:hypothetical protein